MSNKNPESGNLNVYLYLHSIKKYLTKNQLQGNNSSNYIQVHFILARNNYAEEMNVKNETNEHDKSPYIFTLIFQLIEFYIKTTITWSDVLKSFISI